MTKSNLLKNACLHSMVNCKEVFIYEYPNGKRCYSDLYTLNHIVNDCRENVKILYNIYRNNHSQYITINNMQNNKRSFYNFVENKFFAA